jgi:hypothetical protein
MLQHAHRAVAQPNTLETVAGLARVRQRLALDDLESRRQGRLLGDGVSAQLRARRVSLVADDLPVFELEEMPLAPDLSARLALELEGEPTREMPRRSSEEVRPGRATKPQAARRSRPHPRA